MELNVVRREKQVDVHFYIRPGYAQTIDDMADKLGVSRGRVLEALVDHYNATKVAS
jgi:hypothetical protein